VTSDNSGISISGGTVNAGAIAAGNHAQAKNVSAVPVARSVEEVRTQLADLVRELRAHQDDFDDGAQAIAVAEMAAREAAKERPNRASFLGLMHALASGVGSVASVATVVTALEQASAALF
jgi:hypothetical protein